MNRTVILFTLSLTVLFFVGCAMPLNVAYNLDKVNTSPLSSLQPLNIEITEFVDKRPETDVIGYVRNVFGNKVRKIVTNQPVNQIVRDAFVVEFKTNGHNIVSNGNKDISISGMINTFWFDAQTGWTVELIGTVNVDLKVINSKTGKVLLTRTYQGYYNEESRGGGKGTAERVHPITR